ncbi:MAG TPA: serine/threonine-protein kinase [Bryobacteraceae bacterium]|nr:serine/threonine-protein kinase [Bryobacteraceae bacterium]
MKTRAEELFHEVADLSAEARGRYFAEHAIDPQTRTEVEELLGFDVRFQTLELKIAQVAQTALTRVESQDLPCGPYRLQSLLGSGGMGSVYLAERVDGELAQRVAVKLLRPGAESAHVRQRFLAERQILANLSHPNIATMLDAGHREDGQPYLVMEHIEGKSIDVFAANLSVRQKILLFLKVCSAASYLHRNLVVHRDLKPANILITAEGEPKLLDFGIAKLLDLTTDFTATNLRMLTPDYASPEQVTGGQITTATDIYSLGAVLYRILTGDPPHQFDSDSPGAIALTILHGKIIPPSKLAPNLKGDLDIVLMKALRHEPQERYSSVDALADDLSACLERRPVQARAGDVWYRTRRWLRTYWLQATAVACVVGGLSTGLYVANRQRLQAEHRFSQLRQLSNRVIDLDSAIRTLPGSVEARRRLVSASLEYLEGLAGEARGNLDLAQDVSDGYWRMARIQGVNAEYNLGDTPKALQSLKKAEALIDVVLAARPNDRNALFRSALINHDRMILSSDDRREDTLALAKKSADRLETFLRRDGVGKPVRLEGFLGAGDPRDAEHRGAATIFSNIGLAFVNAHHFEDGADYARRSVELSEPIAAAQDIAAGALSVLANALRYQGDLNGALATIRRARTLMEHATFPNEAAREFNQYGPILREGRLLGERDAVNLNRPAEAAELLQRAIDIGEEIARRDSTDAASRTRIGSTARELGDILRDSDPRRALAIFDLGIQRQSEMRDNPHTRRERAELIAKSAYPLRRLHRTAEARKRLDTAVAMLTALKDYPAKSVPLGNPIYSVMRALADHEAEAGNIDRAREFYEDFYAKILASQPEPESNLQDAARISSVYAALADVNRRAGHADRASEVGAQRLALWQHWDTRLPNNEFVRRQLDAAMGRT